MKKIMTVLAIIALVAFAAPAFAATNPFMDVPAGHWAYDAVTQLASRGIVSGYPDGSYKGAQPATRYEMASIVGRVIAKMDMEKASQQDAELMKKLVLEFKNELDALGVKVNNLDKRVAVLEDGVGGWKIRGIFQFDAKFGNSSNGDSYHYSSNNKRNEFDKERFRLFLTKTIDENTYFYAQLRTGDSGAGGNGRGAQDHMRWSDIYVDTQLPWDVGFRVGRFAVDFEDDNGLYKDNDALFGAGALDGFRFKKSFGMLNATAVIGRNFSAIGHEAFGKDIASQMYTEDHMMYALDLNFQPNEKFFLGATGYWRHSDAGIANTDYNSNTYGFYAGYNFTPNVALKGIYYFQDNDLTALGGANLDDRPNAWKAALAIDQKALKFTSLWIEYSQVDNTFFSGAFPRYSIGNTSAHAMYNRPLNNETTSVLFVKAEQKWNDKWNTWLRFAHADFNTRGLADSYEYGIGVGYQYSSAIKFELAYDLVDYGSGNAGYNVPGILTDPRNDRESIIRFRTTVNF